MKILIVDDSRVMRQMITRALRQAGFTGHHLAEAVEGRDGLRAFVAHDADLVLSDWAMPEMSGLELLQALRARGERVPFVFITWDRSPAVLAQAEAAGAFAVIPKPFTAEVLRDVLQPLLGRDRVRS